MSLKIWIYLILLIIIDTLAVSIINHSAKNNNNYYILGMFLFSITGYLLYKLLHYKKLILINAIWDTIGLILLTSIAIIIFKEKIDLYNGLGIIASIISLILINYKNIKS